MGTTEQQTLPMLRIRLQELIDDPSRTELELPGLTAEERKGVKELCAELLLDTRTFGIGDERTMHVQKTAKKPSPQPVELESLLGNFADSIHATPVKRRQRDAAGAVGAVGTPARSDAGSDGKRSNNAMNAAQNSFDGLFTGESSARDLPVKGTFIHFLQAPTADKEIRSLPEGQMLQNMLAREAAAARAAASEELTSTTEPSQQGDKDKGSPPKLPNLGEWAATVHAPGTRVVLRGLGAAEFNGRSGTVETYCAEEGRYDVFLEPGPAGQLQWVRVRPEHLLPRGEFAVQTPLSEQSVPRFCLPLSSLIDGPGVDAPAQVTAPAPAPVPVQSHLSAVATEAANAVLSPTNEAFPISSPGGVAGAALHPELGQLPPAPPVPAPQPVRSQQPVQQEQVLEPVEQVPGCTSGQNARKPPPLGEGIEHQHASRVLEPLMRSPPSKQPSYQYQGSPQAFAQRQDFDSPYTASGQGYYANGGQFNAGAGYSAPQEFASPGGYNGGYAYGAQQSYDDGVFASLGPRKEQAVVPPRPQPFFHHGNQDSIIDSLVRR